MESQLHRHHEDHPHRIVEEEHKEKKSVLKKVKEKAKKIKNTITKHGHGHNQGDEQGLVDVESREENYQHKADDEKGDVYESTVIRSKDLPQEAKINQEMDHSKDHEKPKPEEEEEDVTFEQAQPSVLSNNPGNKPEAGQESVEPENEISKGAKTAAEPEPQPKPEREAHRNKPITETVSECAQMIAEKLKPGEEDKALSEAVTDKLEKATEGMHLKDGKNEHGGGGGPPRLGEVRESEEVKARLGPVGEGKREGKDAFESGVESSGDTVVDRVKDAVGSWLGKSEGTRTAQQSLGESYANNAGGGGGGGQR